MTRLISTFDEFKNNHTRIYEGDGFGTSPFLLKKQSDIYNYFFNIESGGKEENLGFHLVVGKYSEFETVDGPKNSYCVLSLNEIPHEIIEDIAIDKEDIPQMSDTQFIIEGDEVSRLMEYVSKCLQNYLEFNSKVSRIYDELQANLVIKGKGEYIEFMKSIILSYLGKNWSVQEGSTKKSIIISR
jgi:hypothetical protein